jgi:hypothetical protein
MSDGAKAGKKLPRPSSLEGGPGPEYVAYVLMQ